MREELVLVDTGRDGVVRLLLNRPERLNALTSAMLEQLLEGIAQAGEKRGARVLILEGRASAFCAGMDLHEANEVEVALSVGRLLKRVLVALATSRLITLAIVRGPAVAGGAALVLACDLALAAADASFGFPELRRGIVPAMAVALAARRLGDRVARHLAFEAQVVSAQRARELGAFSQVVPAEALEDESARLCSKILATAPQAGAETKAWLEALAQRSLATVLEDAYERFARAMSAAEAGEGLAAFRERREPEWKQRLSAGDVLQG